MSYRFSHCVDIMQLFNTQNWSTVVGAVKNRIPYCKNIRSGMQPGCPRISSGVALLSQTQTRAEGNGRFLGPSCCLTQALRTASLEERPLETDSEGYSLVPYFHMHRFFFYFVVLIPQKCSLLSRKKHIITWKNSDFRICFYSSGHTCNQVLISNPWKWICTARNIDQEAKLQWDILEEKDVIRMLRIPVSSDCLFPSRSNMAVWETPFRK